MINLSSEPSLGSMVLTSGGVWKYSYILPRGMTFPEDTEGWVLVTARDGTELAIFNGELGENLDRINFKSAEHEDIPDGANWELFVRFDGDTYKVRYGRVVRREPDYPLHVTSDFNPLNQAVYEDTMDRSTLGPRWIDKYGKTAMHPTGGSSPSYLMAVRNIDFFLPLTLWEDSAVLWYAPTKTDSFDITVRLWEGGSGKTTIAFCSNYTMTNYLGVMFDATGTDAVRVVTGSGPISTTNQASWTHTVSGSNKLYTIRYTLADNKVEVWEGAATGSADLSYVDSGNIVSHGAGHRYVGASWQSSFASTGPKLGYFKVEDHET